MGCEHQRAVEVAVEVEHLGGDLFGGGAVELAGRLVGQHHGGARNQRAAHGGALALAAGQLMRLVAGAAAQADAVEHGEAAVARVAAVVAAYQQRHHDILQHAEIVQQVVELINKADAAVAKAAQRGAGQRRQRLAAQPDVAGVGAIKAAQQVQQRALARTGHADDGDALARRRRQVEALQHLDAQRAVAVTLAQRAALNGGRGHDSPSTSAGRMRAARHAG